MQSENCASLGNTGMAGQGKGLLALLSSPLQNMCCSLAPPSFDIKESLEGP